MSFELTEEHTAMVVAALHPLYLNLARCALLECRNRDVLEWTSKAINAFGKNKVDIDVAAKVAYLNGKSYVQCGQFNKAEIEFQKALILQPDDDKTKLLLRY